MDLRCPSSTSPSRQSYRNLAGLDLGLPPARRGLYAAAPDATRRLRHRGLGAAHAGRAMLATGLRIGMIRPNVSSVAYFEQRGTVAVVAHADDLLAEDLAGLPEPLELIGIEEGDRAVLPGFRRNDATPVREGPVDRLELEIRTVRQPERELELAGLAFEDREDPRGFSLPFAALIVSLGMIQVPIRSLSGSTASR